MEIEEMKVLWSDLSDQLNQQKKLTNDIIMSMTQEKYINKFRTISKYETIGACICFAIVIYVLANFGALDTWFLKTCGIFTAGFLCIQPILTLRTLSNIKRLNILDKTYSETLVSYTKAKTNLLKAQQFGIFGSFVFMFTSSPVLVKILTNKDFYSVEHNVWAYLLMGITVVLAIVVCRWGYKHYQRITHSAEELIKGLE